MINWNEVTVGETELLDKHGTRRLVLTVYGNMVGTKIQSGDYITDFGWWRKQDITDWTIYDPWVDVSDQCIWQKAVGDSSNCLWFLAHNGQVIRHYDYNFKSDGRRVWKRKEIAS